MKTERITLRITPTLRKQLEGAAKKDGRPLSNYVEKILLDAMRERSTETRNRA